MSTSDEIEAPARSQSGRSARAGQRLVGLLLFVVGIALGLALAVAGVWADAEAVFYGFGHIGDESLRTLRCPVLMTRTETAQVWATVRNPFEQPIEFRVRADFSSPGELRSERQMVALAPGEKKRLEWTVSEAERDLGFFVFAKVGTYPAYTMPFREQTCGIVMLGLPGMTGGQVQALVLVGFVVGVLGGIILWQRANRPLHDLTLQMSMAMRALAMVVLAAILVMQLGAWPIAALLIVLALVIVLGVLFVLATR